MNPRLWFYDQNVHIFPIDRRDKSPMVPKGTSQFDYRCTRREAERLGDYGVPLGLYGVADSDDPASEEWVNANLPATPFLVATARGLHRYYRLISDAPHFFHRAGLTIEFRHRGQYVVGPGSVHKSGAIYEPSRWSWNPLDVPIFPVATFEWDDRPLDQRGSTEGGAPLLLPAVIKAGERHDLMFRLMRSLQARGVTDLAVLLKVLHVENQRKCSPPIERNELERYITRVSKYRDAPGFERDDQDGLTVAGGMLETGLSTEAATILVLTADPAFDPSGGPEYVPEPSQPSQPFSAGEEAVPIESQGEKPEGDIGIPDIAKPLLSCCVCGHGWQQRRATAPKRCPRCDSTLWNREQIVALDDGENGEIIDMDEGDEGGEIIDMDEGDEDVEIIDEDDEDGPIYDEDTLEIVGHSVKGVITWITKK